MGRPATPTATKELNGNPGQRPIPQDEPRPQVELPDPPPSLRGLALEKWYEVGNQLVSMRVMTAKDAVALEAFCVSYQQWRFACDRLETEGWIVTGTNKRQFKSPWVGIKEKCLDQVLKFLIEFGMTPAARTRVSMIDTPAGGKGGLRALIGKKNEPQKAG